MTEQIAIAPPEVELTGPEIIEDLVNRISSELERSCHLSATCAYRAYSGKATLELQLEDIDTTKIAETITIGEPDPGLPLRRFEVEIPGATPSVVRERSGLTAPSLDKFEGARAPVEKKRYYTPRQSKSGTTK